MVSFCDTCLRCGVAVVFESESESAICPECGWSRDAARGYATQKRKERRWKWIKFTWWVFGVLAAVGFLLVSSNPGERMTQSLAKAMALLFYAAVFIIVVAPLAVLASYLSTGRLPRWLGGSAKSDSGSR